MPSPFASTDLPHLDLPVSQQARGQVQLPGSKSISNRVLLLAALAEGRTTVTGLLDSDDTRVMLDALKQLGVALSPGAAEDEVVVSGGRGFPVQQADLFMGNAGTAIRPLTAALAWHGGQYRLHGVPRMHERPIGDLVDALRQAGAAIAYQGNDGYPPLSLTPPSLDLSQPIRIKGNVSSQFLTALLLAAPIACAKTGQDVRVEVVGELISTPYIAMTLNLMRRFGVEVERRDWQAFRVPAASRYVSPGTIRVEGDASSASYFLALGAIAGGPLRVEGVDRQSIQGDVAFADTLEAMGASVTWGEGWIEVGGEPVAHGARLKAFDTDFNLIPDAAMTAAVLALYADGPCRLRNIASWRVKETDRIHAMETELRKLGATVSSTPDSLTVTPPTQWRPASIETYDDHRMAMCFSLAVFGGVPVRILEPACVSKTFPTYFDVYRALLQGANRKPS